MPVGDVVGFAVIAGSRIILPAEIATIDASAQIPAIATIGTIQFANISVGTVEVGTISVLLEAGTVGTIRSIQSGNVSASRTGGRLQDIATIGTIVSGYVSADRIFKQTNVVTSAFTGSFVGTTIGTLLAQNLQDLVVDAVYGTVLTGSIQTSVVGVEPQTGVKTSTIVAGSWFAGTLVTGQRLVAAGPLGAEVAVVVAATGTVQGVWVTAQQASGP